MLGSVVNAISSDLKDLDGDTYLEFGGTDLTEVYPNRDSMYYVPYAYYEIRDGRIQFDSAYTKKIDIQENGIYLTDPGGPNGFCCKVVPKPANKRTYIVIDTSIKSERIDGPAAVPEKVISRIIRRHRTFDVADLDDFIQAFGFDISMEEHYPKLRGFYLDESRVYGEPSPLRMFLIFNKRTLIGVVHKRKLDYTGLKEIKLNGGYSLTVLANQDGGVINLFVKNFNKYVAIPTPGIKNRL